MFPKITLVVALLLMLGGVVTIDTQQISFTPSVPTRLILVAAGCILCLVSIFLRRQERPSGQDDANF